LHHAICQVWASQWTERAVAARQRLGIDPASLHMAVLLQQVVPCDYAFVLHTHDPTTGRADRLYGELVPGLGETLVGNEPGRPLAFFADKQSGEIEPQSLPSKSRGLFGDGVFARSDSNGEDLGDYAGAGLYDSVMTPAPTVQRLAYTDDPIVANPTFRGRLVEKCVQLGLWVERQYGQPQDIEGGFHGEQLYLLQTRNQVGLR
jgi:alpha-glucan,water dikinase